MTTQSSPENDALGRMERLVERLLDGAVLAFVGAGISQQARLAGDSSGFKPTVDWMKRRLVEKINAYFNGSTCSEIERHQVVRLVCQPDGKCQRSDNCSELCEQATEQGSLSNLAEIATWIWDHQRLCEFLSVGKFACLKPLPAHRYLAYLARDGLITEIISTNWDCCIEKAFHLSFGDEVLPENRDSPLAVIRTLEEYRTHGARIRTGLPTPRPVLHLYKINGCAKDYRVSRNGDDGDAARREAARRIVVTERQLQSFGDERWARDLFRDRTRSRNLLFCGFGSEEPQVRHTTLALMEEFGRNGTQSNKQEAADLPNAPFVASYSDWLSFAQSQILAGFFSAHVHTFKVEDLLNNVFQGRDACPLRSSSDEPVLEADLFFQRLFQADFGRVLRRRSSRGSLFFKWLEQHTESAPCWREALLDSLYPRRNDPNDHSFKEIIGQVPRLFGEQPKPTERPLLLWSWLYIIKHPELGPRMSDWYLPLREDELFILVALLIIVVLALGGSRETDVLVLPLERVVETKGAGLEIRLSDEPNGSVFLAHEQAPPPATDIQHGPSRLLRQIGIPALGHQPAEGRWITESDDGQVRVGRYVRVPAREIVRQARVPERMRETLPRVFATYRQTKPRARLTPLEAN